VKKSRYSEEQISYASKQAETGTPVAEVLRRMGISELTFYRWKKLYGGLGVGELRLSRRRVASDLGVGLSTLGT
jgi:putative transposase